MKRFVAQTALSENVLTTVDSWYLSPHGISVLYIITQLRKYVQIAGVNAQTMGCTKSGNWFFHDKSKKNSYMKYYFFTVVTKRVGGKLACYHTLYHTLKLKYECLTRVKKLFFCDIIVIGLKINLLARVTLLTTHLDQYCIVLSQLYLQLYFTRTHSSVFLQQY